MVKHVVLFRVKPGTAPEQVEKVFAALRGLKGKIPGILDFSAGAYSSPEGLSRGYTHGFIMTFADAGSRDAYLPHPEHQKVTQLALPILDGGLEAVVAFDWEVTE